MTTIAIRLRADCPSCGQSIAINSGSDRWACPGCHQAFSIEAEHWRALLAEPLTRISTLAAGEARVVDVTVGTAFHLTYSNESPRCTCGALISQSPSHAGQSISCQRCHARMQVRPAPPSLVELGLDLVVGEDHLPGNGPDTLRHVPSSLHCPGCGAQLPLDTRNRSLRCPYCATDVIVPDDVWQRLHGFSEVRVWYATVARTRGAPIHGLVPLEADPPEAIGDAVFDGDMRLYLAVQNAGSAIVCVTPDLNILWRQTISADWSDVQLAVHPDGGILVRTRGARVANVMSRDDGSILRTVDEGELAAQGLLDRFDLRPGGRDDPTRRVLSRSRWGDGQVWLDLTDAGGWISRTNGFKRVRVPVSVRFDASIGADSSGRIFLLVIPERGPRRILRFTSDAERADVIATERSGGGVLADEDRLFVAPNGTIFLFRCGLRAFKVLDCDGNLLRQNGASRARDEDLDTARRSGKIRTESSSR